MKRCTPPRLRVICYYLIGEEHKEFVADKMADNDSYILTLAAIGRELNIRKQTEAHIHLAAGLPLTWVSEQKDDFKKYLLQRDSADFNFRGTDYHVDFVGADIFPQGFAGGKENDASSPDTPASGIGAENRRSDGRY